MDRMADAADGRRQLCGHGQEFVPWPDKDGYWMLVPVVESVANQLRSDEVSENYSE
jgi:hypothetical protein